MKGVVLIQALQSCSRALGPFEQTSFFLNQDMTYNRSPGHDKTRNDCRKARIEWERQTEMEAVLAAERRAAEEEVRFPRSATARSDSTGSLDSFFAALGNLVFGNIGDVRKRLR
jgi:hypothetical protein